MARNTVQKLFKALSTVLNKLRKMGRPLNEGQRGGGKKREKTIVLPPSQTFPKTSFLVTLARDAMIPWSSHYYSPALPNARANLPKSHV